MVTFAYDYSFLMKTIKYILLPVVATVVVVGFIVFIYSRKSKKENIEKYNYIIDLWTTLLAIFVVSALFAITLGFSLSLTSTIRQFSLIEGHEIIYYLVLLTPAIPFLFFIIYLYKLIITVANKPKKHKEKNKEQSIDEDVYDNKENMDCDVNYTKFNDAINPVNADKESSVEVLDTSDDNNDSVPDEVLDLTDSASDTNDEEIELL